MNEFFRKVKAYVQDPANANFLYTTIALIVTGIFAIAIFYFASRTEEPKDITNVEEQQRVLSEIIRNNPKSIFPELTEEDSAVEVSNEQATIEGANRSTTDTVVNKQTGQEVIVDNTNPSNTSPIPISKVGVNGELIELSKGDILAPDLSLYNYRETVTTTSHGPGFDICSIIFAGGCGGYYLSPTYSPHSGETIVSKDYAYYDQTHSFYRHDISVDGTNARSDIGLYGNDINVNFQTAYGSEYSKTVNTPYEYFSNQISVDPYPDSLPSSYPDSYVIAEEKIRSNFGSNFVISESYEEGDKSFYDVTVSYFVYCEDVRRPLISVYKIDGETYDVVSRSEYIDTISDETLRFTQTVVSERKTVTLEEVQSTFSNESYPGEEVVIDRANFTYDSVSRGENVINYLNSEPIEIVHPDSKYELTSIWGARFPESVPNEFLYRNRSFYADNKVGQQMYDQLQSTLDKTAVVNTSWQNSNRTEYGYIYQYDNSLNNYSDYIPEETFSDWYFSNVDEVEILTNTEGVIDGYKESDFSYSSRPTSYPISYALSYSSSYPSSYGGGSVYQWLSNYSSQYTFELGGYIAQVSLSGNDKVLDEEVQILGAGNSKVLNEIRQLFL